MTDFDLEQEVVNGFRNLGYKVRIYSGRSMYGKDCVGVDFDYGSAVSVVLELLKDLHSDLDELEYANVIDLLGDAREDYMGRGAIVYWPNWTWDDRFKEDDEDSDEDEE